MNLSPKTTRGHGKTEFDKNIEFIVEKLRRKNSVSKIYNHLKSSNEVTIDISLFRRYVRELKIRIAAESNQSKFSAKADSTYPPTPIISSVPPSTSQSKVFDPRALNSKELDDEFGITSSDDSDETSQGSEVSNG